MVVRVAEVKSHKFNLKGMKRARSSIKRDEYGNPIDISKRSNLYNRRWRKASAMWLRNHPLCVHCEKKGLITPACEVDHIVPHRGSQAIFWDETNWQSLCKPHHSAKTAREVNQRGTYGTA